MTRIFCMLLVLTQLGLPAAAQTLDRIKETGQLRLGYRVDAVPLSFQDGQGRPAGYTPLVCSEVAQAITNQLQLENLDATFIPVDANTRFEKISNGEIDLLCGAATITMRRSAVVNFSIPVYVDGTSVLLPKGSEMNLGALAGKKVGVRSGTTTEEAVGNSLRANNIDAEVVIFADHEDGITAMETGQIQAYFADQSILIYLRGLSSSADKFDVSSRILTIEKQGLAMQYGDTDFKRVVDTALSDMYRSGKMEEIFGSALPGIEPGLAIKAMRLIAPTLP